MSLRVEFQYQNKKRHIALFPGIDPEELENLLQSIFQISREIIGFVGQVSYILLILVACNK